MKVLVTGGAGFIGSHVVDVLIEAGHEVVVVDNLSTGRAVNLNPDVRFYRANICDPQLGEIFAAERFAAVMHLAAKASVPESLRQPLLYADVNLRGSLHLLDLSRRHRVGKFVYSSTCAAYGEPKVLPVDETHPIHPLSVYGATKVQVETYLALYGEHWGLRYTALRYANVYGPRQDPFGEAGVVAVFANQMARGEACVINGTGEQERDFVYVGDVAEANRLALERGDGEVFNIGSGRGTSVNQLFDHLREAIGYARLPHYAPPRAGEIQKIYLDTRKAREQLGWRAQTTLGDGLTLTVSSLVTNPSAKGGRGGEDV
ncbi:MAG: NAD-dependent epimerase/dehydratase family protein [Chloroflexi bacterium]|nr:NAD-dependent epimerase/dehydratase family protein [Chloroflexota bacterium]MBI3733357.1 NAD-dependent epimerase/dehydratase family protein [Chloroflexota bacterium]